MLGCVQSLFVPREEKILSLFRSISLELLRSLARSRAVDPNFTFAAGSKHVYADEDRVNFVSFCNYSRARALADIY